MQEIQFYLVDAFSDKNFGGNAPRPSARSASG